MPGDALSGNAGGAAPTRRWAAVLLRAASDQGEDNGLSQGRSTGSDQIGLEHHVAKHRQEKEQKAITEPLGGHPAGRGLAAGAFKVSSQLAEQLPPSAEVIAKEFVPAKDG